jgi:hypothetical protein
LAGGHIPAILITSGAIFSSLEWQNWTAMLVCQIDNQTVPSVALILLTLRLLFCMSLRLHFTFSFLLDIPFPICFFFIFRLYARN